LPPCPHGQPGTDGDGQTHTDEERSDPPGNLHLDVGPESTGARSVLMSEVADEPPRASRNTETAVASAAAPAAHHTSRPRRRPISEPAATRAVHAPTGSTTATAEASRVMA